MFANRSTRAPAGNVRPPGAISSTDRTRMLNSMTLDQMDEYSLLDGPARSAYEDRWLAAHPASGMTNEYRFAEDVLGMANGTVNAIIASQDRQRLADLDARTRLAIQEIQLRRDATTLPLEQRRLDLQIATLENQRQISFSQDRQSGINTTTIVVGGVLAIAIAAAAYAASQARQNPTVVRSGRHVFIPAALLTGREQEAFRRSRAKKRKAA